jgi:hypothetical protein
LFWFHPEKFGGIECSVQAHLVTVKAL